MHHADYHQATGVFRIWDADQVVYSCSGYSGHGAGVNNPIAEAIHAEGPIPRGVWRIGTWIDHPRLGPLSFRLYPFPSGRSVFGRSGFLIHGDNRKRNRSASTGCIVLDRPHRLKIKKLLQGKLLLVHTDDETATGYEHYPER